MGIKSLNEESIKLTLPNIVKIYNPRDEHLHVRWDIENSDSVANRILNMVVPLNKNFSRILVMPNVMPNHIQTLDDVKKYMTLVESAMLENQNTEVSYTISLKPETTAETIRSCAWFIRWVKYYPGWVTTNSWWVSWDLDISNPRTKEVLEAMQEEGIVLNLHPETTLEKNEYWKITKWFVHDAEREFKWIIEQIAEAYPNLKVIVEHISTKENADLLLSWKYSNVYWTITPQHLMLTAHDKEWGHWFDPHIHCKPTLKTPDDLEAIRRLVLSWNKNVFFGSDSAPHPTDKKESAHCAAWVFSSPIAIELIIDWFFDPKTIIFWIDNWYLPENWYIEKIQELIQNFIWNNSNAVYWDTKNKKLITLEKTPFIIPEYYWSDEVEIKPMWAWKELKYSVVNA